MWNTITHRWLKIPYTLHVGMRHRAKKPRATVLFIHGIGTSSAAWTEVINELPDDLNVISIDLLGFGKSPRPAWAVYNAKTQARSVIATLVKLRLDSRLIIVGHSLGALVAVEVARRYPLIVKSLVLCSPPFYNERATRRILPNSERFLRRLYRMAQKHPDQVIKVSGIAHRYGLINKTFDLNNENVASYMSALEATIVNQTSLTDAKKLKKPMTILHGVFDPVVIRRNLRELEKANKRVKLKMILAGHEVQGRYVQSTVKTVKAAAERPKNRFTTEKLRAITKPR